jgi:zinc D-Ala-D-Ala carboxypeptidase
MSDLQFAPNFPLSELVASSKARELGIVNGPPLSVLPRLAATSWMLQRIRDELGVSMNVTSSFRNPVLNKAVGGSSTSDHLDGDAADFVAPAFGTPTQIAERLAPLVSVLEIGQIILEGVKGKQWVHVGTQVPAKAVNRIITITDAGTVPGIVALA